MVHYQRLPEQVQLCYQGILLSTLFSLFLTWTVIYCQLVNSLRKRGVLLIFSSTHCEFQDLDSGKTIGNAEECFGLYILKERHDPQEQPQMAVGSNSFSVSCQNNDSAIRLWHYRLGHPNVMYLKHLFPSLFNKNPQSFECEICQLSKQVRSHFPIQPYKESSPF